MPPPVRKPLLCRGPSWQSHLRATRARTRSPVRARAHTHTRWIHTAACTHAYRRHLHPARSYLAVASQLGKKPGRHRAVTAAVLLHYSQHFCAALITAAAACAEPHVELEPRGV